MQQQLPPAPTRYHQVRSSFTSCQQIDGEYENLSLFMAIKFHTHLKQSLVLGLCPQTLLLPEVPVNWGGGGSLIYGMVPGIESTFRIGLGPLCRGSTSVVVLRS